MAFIWCLFICLSVDGRGVMSCGAFDRVLGLKNTGVGDESVRQLVLGVTHANCRHLAELDVSDGSLGSLGAAWLAGCTSKSSRIPHQNFLTHTQHGSAEHYSVCCTLLHVRLYLLIVLHSWCVWLCVGRRHVFWSALCVFCALQILRDRLALANYSCYCYHSSTTWRKEDALVFFSGNERSASTNSTSGYFLSLAHTILCLFLCFIWLGTCSLCYFC